jgi:hypothetical protein
MGATTGAASSSGLTLGDVIRTQCYRIDEARTIGDAAAEFVRLTRTVTATPPHLHTSAA